MHLRKGSSIVLQLRRHETNKIPIDSRDNGPPYSEWLAVISPRLDVPVNAILLTLFFTCCMSLINLGSKVAFEAMLSLATVALMATYIISIGCVLLKRLRGEDLPSAR